MATQPQTGNKTRKPRQNKVDPNETPQSRFKRLGAARTAKAVAAIKGIGKLTGKAYERTPEQEKKIMQALEDAVQTVRDRFAGKTQAQAGFSL